MGVFRTREAIALLAKKLDISEEEARRFCQAQAELAFEFASRGFPIPGIGVLSVVDRPERTARVPYGPNEGETILIPAKKVLKFRVSKFAKDLLFGPPSAVPDVADVDMEASQTTLED